MRLSFLVPFALFMWALPLTVGSVYWSIRGLTGTASFAGFPVTFTFYDAAWMVGLLGYLGWRLTK